jgi:hypothetical protein
VATVLPMPRKRRTREHVIADQAINHVERFVYDAGFTVERYRHDYGYDLTMTTFDPDGYAEPDRVLFQVKATNSLKVLAKKRCFKFRIGMADLNNWLDEPMPVFLIVYDATRRTAYWLYVQNYFQQQPKFLAKKHRNSITVQIPARNRVTRRFIEFARICKDNILSQTVRYADHGYIDHLR